MDLVETAEWFNKMVFPAPPSTYSAENIPELIYIPRDIDALIKIECASPLLPLPSLRLAPAPEFSEG